MTRAEIARKLLAHGPLTLREFQEITGWQKKAAKDTLYDLRRRTQVLRRNSREADKPIFSLVSVS